MRLTFSMIVGTSLSFLMGACDASETSGPDGTLAGAGMGASGEPGHGGTNSSAGGAAPLSGGGASLSGGGGSGTSGGTVSAAGSGAGAGQSGGAGGMVASAGGTAGASGGSDGNPGACTAVPVNPNATPQAKKLLCYLYSQYKNHVISGQQETSWDNPAGDIDWYTSNGMKPPAILGGDYLYPMGTSDRAIAYWKAGGIPMIRYHMGAPPLEDTYENSKSSTNLDNVVSEGTAENTSFKSKLDYAATELAKLQAENVAVIWAPFHEVQSNGWFWWAKGTGEQFTAIWKYTFDYLTKTKSLNNLVWLMPFSGTPSAAYYPGKAYLDISGPDTYEENQPFSSLFTRAQGVLGDDTMPIPLHETGRIPTPADMFPSAAPWVLFNVWATYQSDGMHNTLDNIKSVYADEHVVTRDELPNLN